MPEMRQQNQGQLKQQGHESQQSGSAAGSFVDVLPPGTSTCRAENGSTAAIDRDASHTTCQQRLYLLLEEPDSSVGARILSIIVLLAIIMSITGFILLTLPNLHDFIGLEIVEIGTTVFFTVEYLLRLYACNAFGNETRLQFIKAPLNVLDVAAVLPWYLEKSLQSLGPVAPLKVLRSVRLIRLFRIFRLGRYSVGMNLMAKAVVGSLHSLFIMGFFLGVAMVFFSSLIYYAERSGCPDVIALSPEQWQAYRQECVDSGERRDLSGALCCDARGVATGFPSIALCFWWAIVTMATVGYGDMVPQTSLGRLVGCVTILAGIVLIALPVAIVGGKFAEAYNELEYAEELFARKQNVNSQPVSTHTSTSMGSTIDDKSVSEATWHANTADGHSKGQSPFMQFASRQKLKPMSKTTTSVMQRMAMLRSQLRRLERSRYLSQSAQEQIRLLMELFDHLDKAERRLGALRERDKALEDFIRREFVAMAQWYDASFTQMSS